MKGGTCTKIDSLVSKAHDSEQEQILVVLMNTFLKQRTEERLNWPN